MVQLTVITAAEKARRKAQRAKQALQSSGYNAPTDSTASPRTPRGGDFTVDKSPRNSPRNPAGDIADQRAQAARKKEQQRKEQLAKRQEEIKQKEIEANRKKLLNFEYMGDGLTRQEMDEINTMDATQLSNAVAQLPARKKAREEEDKKRRQIRDARETDGQTLTQEELNEIANMSIEELKEEIDRLEKEIEKSEEKAKQEEKEEEKEEEEEEEEEEQADEERRRIVDDTNIKLIEEKNKSIDYGGNPQDIDTLKDLQEEFKGLNKVDYEKEKKDAIEKHGFTEHQYQTFKDFRKQNNAEGVKFTDYVKLHHQFEKVKNMLKRSNVDFNQYYKIKTRPKEILETYEDNRNKKNILSYEGVKLDPIEEEIINHDTLTAQQLYNKVKEADEKTKDKTIKDFKEENIKLYFQETEAKDKTDYDFKQENLSSQVKTDKKELLYLCDLLNKTYTEETNIAHTIYYSKKTGSPIARIIKNDEQIILTIRGTNDVKDIYDDVDFIQTKLSEHFKEIDEKHDAITTEGFIDFAKDVYEAVYVDLLKLLFDETYTLTIASHSLGCAAALIFHAIFLSTGQAVDLNVMFGSPRVFYYTVEMFDMFKNENILRICNEKDGITFLPPVDFVNMFHIGKSIILSQDEYNILPYGDFDRDIDYMNELYKLGKSKITGFIMKQLMSALIPAELLTNIFTPAKIQKNLKNAEYFKKIFYDEHTTTTYFNNLNVLPDEINFDIPEDLQKNLFQKQRQKILMLKKKREHTEKLHDYKMKNLPHPNVSPQILGFVLYHKDENVENKMIIFS